VGIGDEKDKITRGGLCQLLCKHENHCYWRQKGMSIYRDETKRENCIPLADVEIHRMHCEFRRISGSSEITHHAIDFKRNMHVHLLTDDCVGRFVWKD
jgi:hypothetical protein